MTLLRSTTSANDVESLAVSDAQRLRAVYDERLREVLQVRVKSFGRTFP